MFDKEMEPDDSYSVAEAVPQRPLPGDLRNEEIVIKESNKQGDSHPGMRDEKSNSDRQPSSLMNMQDNESKLSAAMCDLEAHLSKAGGLQDHEKSIMTTLKERREMAEEI